MNEQKRAGGKPGKRCFTYKNGEIKLHDDIPTAAEYLGVSGASGSYIRVQLNETGVYRPRAGGVCWSVDRELPIDVSVRAYREWKRANP